MHIRHASGRGSQEPNAGFAEHSYELTVNAGAMVSFSDPNSPWQRGSCENTSGLISQYLPTGTDLTLYCHEQVDAMIDLFNRCPRAVHGFYLRIVVCQSMLDKLNQPIFSIQQTGAALGA